MVTSQQILLHKNLNVRESRTISLTLGSKKYQVKINVPHITQVFYTDIHRHGSATQTFDDDATGSIECMMV